MREVDLFKNFQPAAFAMRDRSGRPLTHAIHSEHRRFLKRRRIKRASRVTQMMLGKEKLLCPVL